MMVLIRMDFLLQFTLIKPFFILVGMTLFSRHWHTRVSKLLQPKIENMYMFKHFEETYRCALLVIIIYYNSE